MTGRRDARTPRSGVRISAAGLLGRLRTDAAAVVGLLVVTALAAAAATAVPRVLARASDDAVRYAVAEAGERGDITSIQDLESSWSERDLHVDLGPRLAADTTALVDSLDPALVAVLDDPVATVVTSALIPVEPIRSSPHTVRFWYFGAGAPEVTWIAGGPAPATVTGDEALRWDPAEPWPVAAGLSEEVAEAIDADVGDVVALRNENRTVFVDLEITGIFRPVDPGGAAWADAGAVLRPRVVGNAATGVVQVGGLLSTDSVPAAVRAMPMGSTLATTVLSPLPAAFDAAGAEEVVAAVAGLKARADETRGGYQTRTMRVSSALDQVLTAAVERNRVGAAQAWVSLTALLAAMALVVLLAVRLLVARRADVLATYRVRGASAAGLGLELATESVLVALVGTAAGVVVVDAVLPGAPAWPWVLPVALVAALAPPVVGVAHAARRTGRRRTPANRRDRALRARDRAAARVVLDVAVVLVAVGAATALRARQVGPDGPDPLVAVAPTAVAAAVGLAGVRLLPLALRAALRRTRRSRRVVGVLAAARATMTGAAVLPFVALTVTTALGGLASSTAATVEAGRQEASWTSVGADAVVVTEPDAALATTAGDLGGFDGVDAVAGSLVRGQVFGGRGDTLVEVVVVPAQEYAALVAGTVLADPGIEALSAAAVDAPQGVVPVLASADLTDSELRTLLIEGTSVDVVTVGTAPGRFGDARLVVVDASRLAAADAMPDPDHVWLVGPGAEGAAAPLVDAGAQVTLRSQWLRTAEEDPLGRALLRLAVVAAVGLSGLGALVTVLAVRTSARDRRRTLGMLGALGLDARSARRVTVGEIVPPVALAALFGTACGVGLVALVAGPLGLRIATGQAREPDPVLTWWLVGAPAVAIVTALAMVGAEAARRRRRHDADVRAALRTAAQ